MGEKNRMDSYIQSCIAAITNRYSVYDGQKPWYVAVGMTAGRLSQLPECYEDVSRLWAYRYTTIVYTYYEYENPPTVGGNLIKNGDFSDASFDYGTPYYKLDVKGSKISEYNYWGKDVTDKSDFYTEHKDGDNFISGGMAIVTSANAFWKRYTKNIEKKSGTHFALFDADNSGSKKAWHIVTNATTQPDLKLAKGTNYMFSFWVANINNYGEMNNAAKLQFAIRYKQGGSWSAEELLGKPIDLNNYLDNLWHQNSYVYTSPVDADDVEIMVRDLNASANPGGNDFALDDIKFQPISVVSQAIKHCQRFVLNIYEPPTVVDQPVITILKTPACGKTDFTIQVDVSYSTLNNKFPITLQLTDDVYGDLFATPVTIDPSVNPNSISFTLKSDEYPMLVADGAIHTLTAKITRIDGAGVDKGGSNSATYTAPGVPAINTPATTAQNVACDKTKFDLQVATEYNAFKGTTLHYEWDGAEWTDAENPSLSYKESTLQTATGKLKNLDADGKNHTLRVYSDNALDCEKTITVTAPYQPQISSVKTDVQPYQCGDLNYQVKVTVTYTNAQDSDLVITDEAGHSQTLKLGDPTYASPATWTFDMPWEDPIASHTFKAYFVGAMSCKENASHQDTYTSPAEPKLEKVVTDIPTEVACGATTFDMSVTFEYINQDGTALDVNVDDTIHGTLSSPFVPNSMTRQTVKATFTGLPADGATSRKLNIVFIGGTHTCGPEQIPFDAPITPSIDTAKVAFSAPGCADLTTTLTFDLNYTYQQGNLTYWVDGLSKQTAGFTPRDKAAQTLTGLTVADIPADGKNDHVLHVSFDGANSCVKDFALPAVPFSPVIDNVTVTGVPTIVACDAENYTVAVSFSSHYSPIPADKKIILTYDSLCDTKTIASLALTDFPYNLTLYNIANNNHSIFVAFEDTPDCKKEVKYDSPARETCAKDTAHICLGETYPWPGHGTYTPTTTGEHQYKDNTDSLFLFVHADPNITLLATDMICEDENEIRLPFAITSGTPNRFDVVIADQNFSQDYDGKDTIVLARPASILAGTYTATVTVRDSLVTCFNTEQTTFTIALSDHVYSKWTDVLFVDNSDKLFTAYQWFADGVAMSGETLQRLYDSKGLSGSNILYYCQLTTTDGKTLYTCPQTFDEVTPSRTVDTTPAKVKATTMYDSMGRVIKTTPHFGIYIVVEELENGEIRTHKIAIYE